MEMALLVADIQTSTNDGRLPCFYTQQSRGATQIDFYHKTFGSLYHPRLDHSSMQFEAAKASH
jgi:hypothetical protein